MKLVLPNEQNSYKVQWAFRKSAAKRQHKGQNTDLFQKISEAGEVRADLNGREVSNSYRLLMMILQLPVTRALGTSPACKYC